MTHSDGVPPKIGETREFLDQVRVPLREAGYPMDEPLPEDILEATELDVRHRTVKKRWDGESWIEEVS